MKRQTAWALITFLGACNADPNGDLSRGYRLTVEELTYSENVGGENKEQSLQGNAQIDLQVCEVINEVKSNVVYDSDGVAKFAVSILDRVNFSTSLILFLRGYSIAYTPLSSFDPDDAAARVQVAGISVELGEFSPAFGAGTDGDSSFEFKLPVMPVATKMELVSNADDAGVRISQPARYRVDFTFSFDDNMGNSFEVPYSGIVSVGDYLDSACIGD